MNNRFKKILLLSIFFVIIFSSFAIQVNAEEFEYTVLAPLPGTTEDPDCVGEDCKADLRSYIPGLFKLIIGLASVIAVAYLIFGGFQYITTDAITGKEEGKNKIQNAIYGLIMISVSWLILYTINPRILTFDLTIGAVSVPDRYNRPGELASNLPVLAKVQSTCLHCVVTNTNFRLTQADINRLSCTTCSIISVPHTSGANPNATPELNSRLVGLYLRQNSNWQVSEGYPPVVHHSNDCHFGGTCVDVSLTNRAASDINSFSTNASNSSLRAVYEVATEARRQELVRQGVTVEVAVVSEITGEHFSVYMR